MAEKTLFTKIALLSKTKEQWEAQESKTYIPKVGEICLCEYPNGNQIAKVGNGIDTFENLGFLKAEHGDVMLYYGFCLTAPQDLSGFTRIPNLIKEDLLDEQTRKFKKYTLEIPTPGDKMGYLAIAIDKRFKLVDWNPESQPGMHQRYITVEKEDYTIYYSENKASLTLKYDFTFGLGDS